MKGKFNKKKLEKYKLPPRIIIKFQNSLDLPYTEQKEVENYFLKNNVIQWKNLRLKFPGITVSKVFNSLEPEEIKKLMIKIENSNSNYTPPNFLKCYAIDCPYGTNTDDLLSILSKNKHVEYTYIESDAIPPCNITGVNPGLSNQGYLNASPEGIDAKYAWTFKGGCGEGNVEFIDIERGWKLNHDDIDRAGVDLLFGDNTDHSGHGSAVLGIILMQDNDKGGIGIVPKVKAHVMSQIDQHRDQGGRIRKRNIINDAILKAIHRLNPGDILLIEAQVNDDLNQFPVEIRQLTFDMIESATAMGIIVIEPAGNGDLFTGFGIDLDEFSNTSGKRILNRDSADFKDSGAIMVAASTESEPHGRKRFSNYGSRIDCYAWGSGVFTANDPADPDREGIDPANPDYNPNFLGTSSASAIIAGAAIAVQSIVEGLRKPRLDPARMRSILSSNGTSSSSNIKVMPDLKQIIDNIILPS